ncbi:MAG: galactoside ABC transporter permease [Bacilli bacterium]
MVAEKVQQIDLFKSPDFLNIYDKLKVLRANVQSKRELKNQKLIYDELVVEAVTMIQAIAKHYRENTPIPSTDLNPFEDDDNIDSYNNILDDLRCDGSSRINHLITENRDIKINKQIDIEVRKEKIKQNNDAIKIAKFNRFFYKPLINELVKHASAYSSFVGRQYYALIKLETKNRINEAKLEYEQTRNSLIQDHMDKITSIEFPRDGATRKEKENYRIEIKAANTLNKVRQAEAKNRKLEKISNAKTDSFNAFVDLYGFQSKIRNNHSRLVDTVEYRYRSYLYNFEFKSFLLHNALYFIVLIYFAVVIILSGGSLLTWNNLVAIAGQTSTKLFFSLGVAGIILIAGTDLSIGRMTGLTAIIASIVMSNRVFETNQGWVLDFTSLPDFGKIVVALILAIIFAVIFSALAGFFTARFKMHPFITTLSTQLLIFGLMMIFFSNVPSFRINSNLKSLLAGERNTNIIIASVIAVAIMWFIWNKTKFGKNMYAVGGNSEAAIVSGINVFAVTMSIFMMAGVLYGVGGFFEAIRVGTAQPNTGAGTELDAIAACVVGGISFSGGIGKIRGAVIGTIIFTGITYTLTYLGYDPNIQFVFKGIIIMAAVCLDSLKYLRKK